MLLQNLKLYHRRPCCTRDKICKFEYDDVATAVVMETDCIFINASFKEFFEWIRLGNDDSIEVRLGELQKYPYKDFWCYADYKYMAELFCDNSSALTAIDWSVFGFPDINGYHSTLWVSSDDAYTPCHQDTYGTNLVAQIYGRKKWILYPPSETLHMRPTRIPYEESSIFSKVDAKSENIYHKSYEVDLKPGEILLVPKHWWHYVESTTPSISINTWLEHQSDPHDRIKESLVNLLVYAVKTTENAPTSQWLNPTQELPSSFDSCLELVHNALYDNDKQGGQTLLCKDNLSNIFNSNFLVNCFTDNEVLNKVVDVINRNLNMAER